MRFLRLVISVAVIVPAAVRAQTVGLGGVVRYSFVSPNLYCLDFGYYDVACAGGVVGFDVNPAALARMKTLSLATAGSTTKRSDARLDLQITPDSFYVGPIHIPVSVRFEETGGFDFFGQGAKVGPVAFGFGYRRGGEVALYPTINAALVRPWQVSVAETLSHDTYPQIPTSAGSVPVVLNASGDARLGFTITGMSTISYSPFTGGMAVDFGPTAFGVGATVNLFRGRAGVTGHGGGVVSNVTGTVTASSDLTPWRVNIAVTGSAEDDSVFKESFTGVLDGRQVVVRCGNLTRITNLIAGELTLGSVVEVAFPTTIGSGFTNTFTYASGIPLSVIFDTTNFDIDSLIVDTVNHTISGSARVRFSNFTKTTRVDSAAYPFRLVSQTNLFFSSVYAIGRWSFNLGGGMVGFIPAGQGWGTLYLDTGVRLRAGLDWRLGLVAALQRYQVAKYSVVTPPIIEAGFGVSANFAGIGIDCALSSNVTQAIVEAVTRSQRLPQRFTFTTYNRIGFGLGLRYEF